MANFGVILLECETLIKEIQTSRDKLAVLDKAVTDAQALVDRCKAFAGKNKQALMLAKVQEDDVKRKAAVRDEERNRAHQYEQTLQTRLSELHGMSGSVDAGLKSKLDSLQHRANDVKHYHGSSANVPGLTSNEIMRMAAATEAKAAGGAGGALSPPPAAARGQSEASLPLTTSGSHHKPMSQPSSPNVVVSSAPSSPAAATPSSPAPAPKASTPGPTRGPMLSANSPRSATVYGTLRANSAPREPRNVIVKTPAGAGEAPAAAPEVRKTWNQRASTDKDKAALKPAPSTLHNPKTTSSQLSRGSSASSSSLVPTTKPAAPKAAENRTVEVKLDSPKLETKVEQVTVETKIDSPKTDDTKASTTVTAAAPAPAVTVATPKFSLVVEEEQTVVLTAPKNN